MNSYRYLRQSLRAVHHQIQACWLLYEWHRDRAEKDEAYYWLMRAELETAWVKKMGKQLATDYMIHPQIIEQAKQQLVDTVEQKQHIMSRDGTMYERDSKGTLRKVQESS